MKLKKFVNICVCFRCRTYIKRPSFTAVKWEAYTNPFQYGIWYSIGVLIIISSASITFAKSISKSVNNKNVDGNATFLETTFLVFGAFCGQGGIIKYLLHVSLHC